jgi:small subunit ribosomal protein S3
MGQKVHPYVFRLGVNKDWKSKWFDDKNYRKNLHEDLKIKQFIQKTLNHAAVADLVIERSAGQITINVHTARPGIIIGRGGQGIEDLKKELVKVCAHQKINLNIIEIRQPDTVSAIVAQNIGAQIEKRIPYKRAIKQAIEKALQNKVKGIKIQVKGRLNNVDIARKEVFSKGSIPLHTLRADIDYCYWPAFTSNAGTIGVKVWIYKGEIFDNEDKTPAGQDKNRRFSRPRRPFSPRPNHPNSARPSAKN